MNKWTEVLGISYPDCTGCGQCCRYASPSSPASQLLEKAAKDISFARDFFSIFVPYDDISEVRKQNPEYVDKILKICEKEDGAVSKDNIVFYCCRFLTDDNKCLIYEDRPQLCRDHPDTPYLAIAPGCAYEEWAKKCKEKYTNLQEELRVLKEMKKELENLRYQNKVVTLLNQLSRVNNPGYKFMYLVPSMSLISPGSSWIKIY